MVQSNCGGLPQVIVRSQHTMVVCNQHPHQHAGMLKSHKVHQSRLNVQGHMLETNEGIHEKGRMYQCPYDAAL
jgi:hypothetical protein